MGTETTPEFDIKLYPVPTRSHLNIDININTSEKVYIQVVDMAGRVMKENFYSLTNGFNTVKISVGDLIDGQYFIRMRLKENVVTEKFSKF
ncbi:MAG: T9SS type A sorting domain-containing protein [Bacteroidales bacterium]|nr:T9SS type A sorting domain-containing protein [Bacteroidales bacterium]